jgi:succinate dehydrogenase/fumarate reductase cytochrome b subunit
VSTWLTNAIAPSGEVIRARAGCRRDVWGLVVCSKGCGHDDWVVVPRWRCEASCLEGTGAGFFFLCCHFVFSPSWRRLGSSTLAQSEAATTAAPAFTAAAAALFSAVPSAVVYFAVAVHGGDGFRL